MEWKKIPGYTLYEASSEGDIKTFNWKNTRREAIIKPHPSKCGDLRTMLKRDIDGKTHTVKVHRMVCAAFHPNPENKSDVNHLDGNRANNAANNLEWATRSENVLHAFKTGLSSNRGAKNPAATLTEEQVLEIRANYVYGKKGRQGVTKKELAEKYGCGVAAIKLIVQGKSWKHLL